MKLSAWARKQGISYQTAWNWFAAGQVLTSFCARLYGRRSARHKAQAALDAAAR